ncbi:MAG: Glycerate kinase [Streptosporangiaceae bacterium]|nr:Glycerate kinase [Streptosporangiaceae bacterium]
MLRVTRGPLRGPVLLAPDKFKGTLDAAQVAACLAEGFRRAAPGLDIRTVPVADGGDGSIAAALRAGYHSRPVRVCGPVGDPVDTYIALRGSTAIIEIADVCGLRRLSEGHRAPLTATSHGVGEAVLAALDAGATTVVIALGGSATTDGGAGLLTALGARLTNAAGRPLGPGGGSLADLAAVDLSGLDRRLRGIDLVLASDVDNPLLGPHGAARTYGPQKGAGPADVECLEAALNRLVTVLPQDGRLPGGRHVAAREVASRPGAGAAGGLGFAALLLGAVLRPGADFFLGLLDFDRALAGAQLVVTGEGALDAQSLRGKAPIAVARRAAAAGSPAVAVVGACALPADRWRATGLLEVHALVDLDPACARSPALTARLLEHFGHRLATAPLPTYAGSPSA